MSGSDHLCVQLLNLRAQMCFFPQWHLQAVVFKVFIWGRLQDKHEVLFCWPSTLFCIWRRVDTATSHNTEDQSEVCWHHQHTAGKLWTHPDTPGRHPQTPAGRSRRRRSLRCSCTELAQEHHSHDFLSDSDPAGGSPLQDETDESYI